MWTIIEATTQAIHVQALLHDFGEDHESPTMTRNDSNVAHDSRSYHKTVPSDCKSIMHVSGYESNFQVAS